MRNISLPEISALLKANESVGSLNSWLNSTKVFNKNAYATLLSSNFNIQETSYSKPKFSDLHQDNLTYAQLISNFVEKNQTNYFPTLDMLNIPIPLSLKNSRDMGSLSNRSKSINTLKKSANQTEFKKESINLNR